MRSKKLTYFLLLLVAVVWGLIIYRIVAAAGNNDDAPANIAIAPIKEPYNDYTIPKDTTRLLLNYRDPFGLTAFKDTSKAVLKVNRSRNIAKTMVNWTFIKYSGYMHNPGSKKLIAILTINGKTINMAEGETVDKVKLIQNKRDSVKVLFNGKTKFIALH